MLKISKLDKNSVARRFGIKANDEIVQFDGEQAKDMLDVAYYDSQSDFSVTLLRGGKQLTRQVHKAAGQPMGWDFYDECYIEPHWCANKCVFCFVDQLPKGQRKTLYVKDDDWRLSFVSGNYVTLTNVSDAEIERIISKRFSPLYISVHATDEDLRRQLLGNPKARHIMPVLQRFAENGISMFTQIVMCKDLNDGKQLEKTLKDLYTLYPAVKNVAVVPVGLTKHRSELCNLSLIDEQTANRTIDFVEKFDNACFKANGTHFAYCSDEMYLYARRDVPGYEYYGDFGQLENGVGLIADFRYQFDLAFCDAVAAKGGSFTVVTGVSATPLMQETLAKAKAAFPSLCANVVTVRNKFFGETVTVAGLIVGRDIVDTLRDRADVGDTILLPRVMLREIEDVFLDGMTLTEFVNIVGKKVVVTADGYEFCQAILECE